MSDTSSSNIFALGASLVAASSLVGASAVLYSQKRDQEKRREDKLNKIRARTQRYLEKKQVDQFISDAENQQK